MLRRARLPRPARGAPAALEGAARLLAPRLHDRPGALASSTGASPTRSVRSARSGTTRTSSSRSRRAARRTQSARRPPLPPRLAAAPRPDRSRRRWRRRRGDDLTLIERPGEQELHVPGTISAGRAVELEEAIWERMHFARHLREQRLGEFTIGTDLHRSDSLALVQLLILYHLVTARAVVALGGESARARAHHSAEPPPVPETVPAAPQQSQPASESGLEKLTAGLVVCSWLATDLTVFSYAGRTSQGRLGDMPTRPLRRLARPAGAPARGRAEACRSGHGDRMVVAAGAARAAAGRLLHRHRRAGGGGSAPPGRSGRRSPWSACCSSCCRCSARSTPR